MWAPTSVCIPSRREELAHEWEAGMWKGGQIRKQEGFISKALENAFTSASESPVLQENFLTHLSFCKEERGGWGGGQWMWTGMKLSLCKNSNEVLITRNTSINECFLWNKIKVKPHLSLIKLAWIFPHSDESFALFNYSPCWGQKWRALKFITDTLLNLSVLINHSFKVSSPDTLRKLIFPADLSAQIVKLDTLLLQNVSTDACAGVAVCTPACMCVSETSKKQVVFM